MRKLFPVFGILALALIMAAPASATPIGPSCGTCQGAIYTLTYNTVPVSTTATTTTWQVTLSIDLTGYSGGGQAIDNVSVKVSSSLTSASLVSAPGGASAWTLAVGGLNANGCSGSGSGFECADATTGTPAPLPLTGTYSWVFNLEIPNGGLNTSALGSSIKVRYIATTGKNAGKKVGALVSEDIGLDSFTPPPPPQNPVPEPNSLVLLGTGLVSVAGIVRRRFAK